MQITSLNSLPLTLAAEQFAVSAVVVNNLQQTVRITLTRHIDLGTCVLQHRSKVSIDVTGRRNILNGRVATCTLELPTVQARLIEPAVACPRSNRATAQTLLVGRTIEFAYDLVVRLNLTASNVGNEIGERAVEYRQIDRHLCIVGTQRVAQLSLDSGDSLLENGSLLHVLVEFNNHAAIYDRGLIDTECRELSILQQLVGCSGIWLSGNELHSNHCRQHQECFSHCDYRFLLVIIKLGVKQAA